MTHYIIIKWLDSVSAQDDLFNRISALFLPAGEIAGIHSVEIIPACIQSENRHDLMIRIAMEPDALARFDASEIHREWKVQFGPYLAAKTIFDCE